MVAKPIIKLIDEAILPAMFLIAAKVGAVLLASTALKINFQIAQGGFLNSLPSIVYATSADYTTIENYSNLAMFTVIALGTLATIIKAMHLHDSHISPKLHQKLAKWNLEKLVTGSSHIYHKAAIWLIFLWLTTIFLILSTLSGVTYIQITVLAVFVTANLTWMFAYDVQKEIEISKNK